MIKDLPPDMIQMIHVTKTFDEDVSALIDISLHIPKGELAFVTGPTGAGKTTLLRLLYRDEVPTSGQVLVQGRNVSRLSDGELPWLRRSIGIIFQDFKLLNDRSVYENLAFVCRILGYPQAEEKKRVTQALSLVNLGARSHLIPYHLAGGEQQRVAIARALLHDPLIVLADEPTGNLDQEEARQIMDLLREINLRGATVLVATHDSEPGRSADHHLSLLKGRIVEERVAHRRD